MARHRLVVWLLAVAVVAAACGSDDTAAEDPQEPVPEEPVPEEPVPEEPAPEEPAPEEPELTASWKGVTEDTISVAVSLLDFDALKGMGLQDWGWGDQRLVWEFYVDQLNEQGGINGRQLDVYLDFYNPALAVEAEASCLRMTEDREVFAVIGAFLGPAESATPCLTDQEDLVIFGGTMTVELLEGAEAVWVGPGAADRRRIPIFFELLDREGYLDGRRVAIVTGTENESDTDNVIVPLLDDYGVEIVSQSVNTVSTDDLLAEDQFWDVTSQVIEAADADVIIINGDTTGAIRGIGRNNLDQELWVIAAGQLTNLGTTVDRADADGAITLGGASAEEGWNEPRNAACRKEFTDAHPEIEVLGPLEVGADDEKWGTAIGLACSWLAIFELVMTAAGPELTPATITAAYEGLGDVELPGQFFGSLGPGKPDANDGFRLSAWDSTQGDNGGLVPLTELLDATP